MSKKEKKWGKASFMRSWAEVSKNGKWDLSLNNKKDLSPAEKETKKKQWEEFAEEMMNRASAQGVSVPSELAVWNRIKTLQSALGKKGILNTPEIPTRPSAEPTGNPPTAAELAAGIPGFS